MTFKNILVALDGSKNSQIAAEYGFWLASNLGAKLAGQHVVDPRLVDLFIEPQFAQELGYQEFTDASDKVFSALRKIGNVILEMFATEAIGRGLRTTVFLDEGAIVNEILKYASEFDLLIVGHRGKEQPKLPSQLMLGSVAERVVIGAPVPVLVTVQPVQQLSQILVAFDGSEPARGALLMAEHLAKETECLLKAVTVIPDATTKSKGHAGTLIEEGKALLREKHAEEVFQIKEGAVAKTILEYASDSNSLLVLGAYGYSDPEDNVLGSTTSRVIRQAKTSVLVYKPARKTTAKNDEGQLLTRISK
jgi:nucleotide-binding universal stress UspA family protein